MLEIEGNISEGSIIKFLKDLSWFPDLFSIKLEVNYSNFDILSIVKNEELRKTGLFKEY